MRHPAGGHEKEGEQAKHVAQTDRQDQKQEPPQRDEMPEAARRQAGPQTAWGHGAPALIREDRRWVESLQESRSEEHTSELQSQR